RVRPQQVNPDRATPYEDRSRRALCRICGDDLIRLKNLHHGAAPDTVIKHRHAERDEDHAPDLVWVWDPTLCGCGMRSSATSAEARESSGLIKSPRSQRHAPSGSPRTASTSSTPTAP